MSTDSQVLPCTLHRTSQCSLISIPYASENDPVHLGENLFAYITSGGVSNDSTETLEKYAKLVEKKKNLILLQPHPESEGIGHSFQDPVFFEVITESVNNYLKILGEYK